MTNKSYNFGLIGLGGYIAPRHLKAIKETGNKLIAAVDKNDSVGIIDSYFPDASFFTEFERFDRHVDKLRQKNNGEQIDYVSICTPNYLHDAHMRWALRSGANVICEKPVVLNERNLDGLLEMEQETGKKVNVVLQLRLHPAVQELKKYVENSKGRAKIELTYITPRGIWYDYSWKGNVEKSGGVATNIGVHFFDMLTWIFGEQYDMNVYHSNPKSVSGDMCLQKADVTWNLSVDKQDLVSKGLNPNSAYRSLKIDGKEFDFSKGFTDLHTKLYEETLGGRGFGLEDTRKAIQIVEQIRNYTQHL